VCSEVGKSKFIGGREVRNEERKTLKIKPENKKEQKKTEMKKKVFENPKHITRERERVGEWQNNKYIRSSKHRSWWGGEGGGWNLKIEI
jgi:hypothetical protein